MSASGLIYAAIAIMWAAVLIPMWLRNHESATENRSAERFGQAMRVLSRKEGEAVDHHEQDTEDLGDADHQHGARQPARRPAERPAGRASRPSTKAGPSAAQRLRREVQARLEQQRSRPRRARAPLTLVQRRARTLGVLLGLTLVTLLLSVVTPVPWWAPVPFVLLTGAFVVHLRVQALQKQRRRAGTSAPTRRPAPRPAARPAAGRDSAAGRDTASATQQPATSDQSGVVQGPSRAVVVERKGQAAAAASAEGPVAGETGEVSDDPEAWRPNPLPLPTYVTAPKAVRPIKVIDLTTPGAWTSGRLLDDDVAEEDLLAAQVAEEELDALIGEQVAPPKEATDADGRRAVGD